jgi:hypothetical protein
MDPDATLAIGEDKSLSGSERRAALKDLLLWIERGGWLPKRWNHLSRESAIARCGMMVDYG